jgi:hypothetical protein
LNCTAGWKPGSNDGRKQGEGWQESYVKKILRNRAVIGEYQPHRLLKGKREPIGETIPNYFPLVIDKDVFYRVQVLFRQNIHKGGRTGKVNNLFSHIAKCGYCGGSMAFIDTGPAPRWGQYLVCDRARRGFDCCKGSIKYGEVEYFVLSHCKGLRPQDILNENDDTGRTLLLNELDGTKCEMSSITKEIENLTDSVGMTSDKRVREVLEKRMIEKFAKKDSLKQRMDQLQQLLETSARSFKDTQSTLDSFKKLISVLNKSKTEKLIELRLKLRNEIRKLIRVIYVYPEGSPRYPTIETVKKS